MSKITNLTLAVSSLTALAPIAAHSASRPEKPNVLLILTDDLGWQDVKCYDIDDPAPYETPNIDQMAKESVMFWQAYSPAPVSAPSRGAILSGRHPARLQRTSVGGGSPVAASRKDVPYLPMWYSGRLPVEELIIPELLKEQGYITGHAGKWHIAKLHHSYPQPLDHGFDVSTSDRGVTAKMMPNRTTGFATKLSADPYQVDDKGFPRDQNTLNALSFIEENKDKPFFLYYATWLVHSPIQSRSRELLDKYCKKMSLPFPTSPEAFTTKGQNNPYYGAMVEMMDHYVGEMLDYLRRTEDPRWKGHKLIENTYIIFTSDNGGMEGERTEVYTDNYPLDKGKINAKEGGTRVPLLIMGPDIKRGVQTDVLANGVDFFPTIMSWTSTPIPSDLVLDGADLSQMLSQNPKDRELVKLRSGEVRDFMVHHFPHSPRQSTIRDEEYKLIYNYMPASPAVLELYRLYDEKETRVDIEEAQNLASKMPEKAEQLRKRMFDYLDSMDATYPCKNPRSATFSGSVASMCQITNGGADGRKVWIEYTEADYKAKNVYIIYTDGKSPEEWFRLKVENFGNGRAEATLPLDATHYVWGVLDDHEFWYNYPEVKSAEERGKIKFKEVALAVAK